MWLSRFAASPPRRFVAPFHFHLPSSGPVMWVFLLPLILALVACGYRFRGSGQAPGNIQSVSVAVLQNQTAEIGIETQFTNALINEFVRWKRLKVKAQRDADATLGGRISNINTQAIVRFGPQKTLETRVTVTLQLALKRTKNGEVLWQNQALSYYENYVQSADPLTTSRNRREAIQGIALFLAEKVHNDIFEGF